MKNLNKIIILGLTSVFMACGGPEETKEESGDATSVEETTTEDLSGMDELALDDFQLFGSIYLPNDKKPLVVTTDWGSTEIRVGDYFGIEILSAGISVEEFKTQLAEDLVYTIEYIEDSENLIIYSKSIEGSDIKPEVHFFMNYEGNGELFEIRSVADESFTKPSIEKMVKSAKTFKLN